MLPLAHVIMPLMFTVVSWLPVPLVYVKGPRATTVNIVLTVNPCTLGNFSCFCCLLIFFKINFVENFFQEYHQSVKQFGSRSGLTFCRA